MNKKLKEMFEKLACEMISFVQQGGLQTGQSSGSAFSVDSRAMDAQLTGVYKKEK